MKKIISNLTSVLLNSKELKTIKGGYGGDPSTGCTTYCKDASYNILGEINTPDCNDTICECKRAGHSSTEYTACSCS